MVKNLCNNLSSSNIRILRICCQGLSHLGILQVKKKIYILVLHCNKTKIQPEMADVIWNIFLERKYFSKILCFREFLKYLSKSTKNAQLLFYTAFSLLIILLCCSTQNGHYLCSFLPKMVENLAKYQNCHFHWVGHFGHWVAISVYGSVPSGKFFFRPLME